MLHTYRIRCIGLAVAFILLSTSTSATADYNWQGAGTGGNTATDPADPTTLWGDPANWQAGVVPGDGSEVYLSLSNTGRVYAQNMSLSNLHVDANSFDGQLHIPDAVALAANYIYVGEDAFGSAHQTGGTVTANYLYLGYNDQAHGEYELQAGSLTTSRTTVGRYGKGTFVQTGGAHIVEGSLDFGNTPGPGVYLMSGGTLQARIMYLDSPGGSLFEQTGGQVVMQDRLRLGGHGGPSSHYVISAGQLTADWIIFQDSTAQFDIVGGQVDARAIMLDNGQLAMSGGILNVQEQLRIRAPFDFSGGTIATPAVLLDGASLTGHGSIAVPFSGDEFSTIHVSGGNLSLGDASDPGGFRTAVRSRCSPSLSLRSAATPPSTAARFGPITASTCRGAGPSAATAVSRPLLPPRPVQASPQRATCTSATPPPSMVLIWTDDYGSAPIR